MNHKDQKFNMFCSVCWKRRLTDFINIAVRTIIGIHLYSIWFTSYYLYYIDIIEDEKSIKQLQSGIMMWGIFNRRFSQVEAASHFYFNHPQFRKYDLLVHSWREINPIDYKLISMSPDQKRRLFHNRALELQEIWGDKGLTKDDLTNELRPNASI